jgi:hypothetical protein
MDYFPERHHRDRLFHLYSENAATEEETIAFWSRMLKGYCAQKQSPRFTIQEIVQQFTTSGVKPAYFFVSLQILRSKSIVVDELFLRNPQKTEETILSSLMSSLWSTIWSVDGSANKITEASTESYILLSILEEMSQMVLRFASVKEPNELFFFNHHQLPSSPYTFAAFLQKSTEAALVNSSNDLNTDIIVALSKLTKPTNTIITTSPLKSPNKTNTTSDISILIDYMLSHKMIRISENGEYLQIILPDSKSDGKYKQALTEEHPCINILRIRSSLHQLTEQLHIVQEKIRFYEGKAKHAKCIAQNTTQALQYLHLKRLCMKQETCMSSAQFQLEETLHAIESTRMNVNIVDAYRTATIGLKAYRKAEEITIEKVEDALDAFQEELDTMQEISKVMSDTHAGTQRGMFTVEEEKSMEEELNTLFAEAEKSQTEDASITINVLPIVPSTPIRPEIGKTTQSPAQPTFSP